jgi:DNA-binding CsgD family transcriptional regulator
MPPGSDLDNSSPLPPDEIVTAWQLLMMVVARSLDVAVGLVVHQTGDDRRAQMAPNFLRSNPFVPKELHDLAPGLLSQRVISDETQLVIMDAQTSAAWQANPELKLGLVSYLAYPVFGLDGEVFGTICVLDDEPRDFSRADRALLLSARDAIHDSLGVSTSTPVGARTKAARSDRLRPAPESFGLWDFQPATGQLRMSPSVSRIYCTHGESAPTTIDEWISRVPSRYALGVRRALEHAIAGAWELATCAAIVPAATGVDIVRILARGVMAADGSLASVVGVQTVMHAESMWLSAEAPGGDQAAWIDLDSQLMVVEMSTAMAGLVGLDAPQTGMPVRELLADTVESAITLSRFREAVQGPRRPQFKLVQVRPDGPPFAAVVAPLPGHDGEVEANVWRVTLIGDDWHPSIGGEGPRTDRDDVTGLPTRSALEQRIRTDVARAPDTGSGPLLTLTLVEVSNLHVIVSQAGHQAAEACLAQIAETIQGEGRFVTSVGLCFLSVLTHGRDLDLPIALRRELRGVRWDQAVAPTFAFSTIEIETGDQRSVGDLLAAATPWRPSVLAGDPPAAVIATPRTAGSSSGTLTAREREVVALVAEGLTNKAISHALHLAVRTVEGHLERVRIKLGLHSRTQIVAWYYTQHPDGLSASTRTPPPVVPRQGQEQTDGQSDWRKP